MQGADELSASPIYFLLAEAKRERTGSETQAKG
jgi:hypothetical protein